MALIHTLVQEYKLGFGFNSSTTSLSSTRYFNHLADVELLTTALVVPCTCPDLQLLVCSNCLYQWSKSNWPLNLHYQFVHFLFLSPSRVQHIKTPKTPIELFTTTFVNNSQSVHCCFSATQRLQHTMVFLHYSNEENIGHRGFPPNNEICPSPTMNTS